MKVTFVTRLGRGRVKSERRVGYDRARAYGNLP